MPQRRPIDTASVEIDGHKLRTLRKLQGDTLITFSEKVGISFGFLSQVERGTRNVGPSVYVKICDTLSITPDNRAFLMRGAARRRAGITARSAA